MYHEDTPRIIGDPYAPKDYPPIAKDAEDDLIRRAVRGEAGALGEILGRYRGLLVAETHASYLRNALPYADAAGIAELAFIEALHDYDPEHGAPFAGFVKSRVHMALYDALRRQRRLWERESRPAQSPEGADMWEHIGGTSDPTAAADRRLLVEEILARTMHRLTEREKKILSLHYYAGLTLRRIAALLGTSAGALSKSKANLLRKLRANAALPIAPA